MEAGRLPQRPGHPAGALVTPPGHRIPPHPPPRPTGRAATDPGTAAVPAVPAPYPA
ncbi:hypothetical protein HMPREF1486_06390 [Streptomyces sp. HPH0547]|nr:hypothetical protein HMPREF1486_06390 [Streptomyces sp. HPH0547]